MNTEKLKELIKHREEVERISHGEWADEIEKCQKHLTELLVEDMKSTIAYISDECTSNEYIWISEVLDDIIELAPSKDFLRSFSGLKAKYPDEYSSYHIEESIQSAESILNYEVQDEKKD